MVKFPSKSEVVPLVVPTIIIVAPGNGTPSSSVIFPEIDPCENANCAIKNREII